MTKRIKRDLTYDANTLLAATILIWLFGCSSMFINTILIKAFARFHTDFTIGVSFFYYLVSLIWKCDLEAGIYAQLYSCSFESTCAALWWLIEAVPLVPLHLFSAVESCIYLCHLLTCPFYNLRVQLFW